MYLIIYACYYHWTNFLQLITFLQSHLASSICLKPLTYFFGIFGLDVLFTNMNFSRFLLHGENGMWWYTLLEAVAWSWRHLAQFSDIWLYSYYFIGCPIWYIQVLGEVRAKLPEHQDLWGRRSKTHNHTIISIPTLNTYNNVDFSFSHSSCLVFSVVVKANVSEYCTFCAST